MQENGVRASTVVEDGSVGQSLENRIKQAAKAEFGLDPSLLEFPGLFSWKENNEGERYVEDMKGAVRYYPSAGEGGRPLVELTDDFREKLAVAESNQRDVDIQTIMGR